MADTVKNMVSVLALVCFMIGMALTGYGIFRTNEMSEKHLDEAYIIPSQVLNGLTVMFLLYLTATSSFSPSYKLFIIVVLVGGMMIEIYLTTYSYRKAESIAAYLFISLNFLLRAFFLIDLVQGEWVKPFTGSIKPVQKAMKEAVKEVAAVPETIVKEVAAVPEAIVKEVAAPTKPPSSDVIADSGKELVSKWDKLKDSLKKRPEGLDESTTKDPWLSVIKPAREQGRTDIKEVLKEATAKLKDKSGNPIPLNSVDAVGGRKRS